MAAKLLTHFLSHGWIQLNSKDSTILSPGLLLRNNRNRPFLSTCCKMRQRNFSSHQKRQIVKKISLKQPQIDAKLQPNGEEKEESESASSHDVSSSRPEIIPDNDVDSSMASKHRAVSLDVTEVVLSPPPGNSSSIVQLNSNQDPESVSMNLIGRDKQSSIPVEDLITMIRNTEKNVLVLNQARVRAFEDLENILHEKEALQGEINVLEMKVAETDAKIKVAAQQKIHIELLEEQLEKMKNELSERCGAEGTVSEISTNDVSQSWNIDFHNLSKDLSSLKAENLSLKQDLKVLRDELSNANVTDERVAALEEDRLRLESTVKDLESKLAESQEDVSKLSALRHEYDGLCQKIEKLKALLDDATKQADQAILVSQQNLELHKKVDRLEKSLEEANVYKLSSEELQQHNQLMQQKINELEERLEKSDEEINSYIQFYQESMKEFQDTLDTLKQESGKKAADEPVDDMPWEFWSQMLLKIDGWLLEKQLSSNDAKMLREMVWKRERHISDAYMTCKENTESELLGKLLSLTSSSTRSGLYVIHIAAEMAPVAKVGGLGDVVTGLGKALQKKGHLVEIVLPKYDCMQYDFIDSLRALDVEIESYFDGQLFKNKIWVGTVEGLPVYFIEPHHPAKFFWRGQYYGENDDFKRFSFFSRAALELLHQSGKKPDIIHCHDWQTSFVAPLYWNLYAPKGSDSARICFTCHNFEYQGTAPAWEIASCGLDVYQLNRPDRLQDHSAHDRVNPVKGAVVYSNIVTTVSPTYAHEVQTPEGGKGLHTTLNTHAKKFVGILNGIDTDSWNPATDSYIQVQYNSCDLQGKAANKEALRKQLGLSYVDPRQPLVGCITRLVPQKGVHLIRHAIYRTMELGGQFVLLGSSPVHHIQKEFESIASHFQNDTNVRLILKYDGSLSHSIYAASDIFIIPSMFEPCGLTQMIAMRYGSIPVARKTGGLSDTVFDVEDEALPPHYRNGFTFISPDEQGLNSALDRALCYYMGNREDWEQLVQKVMSTDFSWETSASEYVELYAKAAARARAARNT